MTHPNSDIPEHSVSGASAKITYWLQHNGQFVASVLAPPGLPGQTVRFLAAHEFDRVPLCDLPTENPAARRRRILQARVIIYGDSSNDMFAEAVKEVA